METNWKPLETRLGRKRCLGFMYMGRVNGINLYKHGITRTYLNLDDEGKCYIGTGSELETPYDDVFIMRKRKELRQRGVSLLTLQIEPQEIKVH